MADIKNNLFEQALACIELDNPFDKASTAQALYERWTNGELVAVSTGQPVRIVVPGRPERPRLVDPRKVPKRGFKSRQGLLRLVHAITHIEFNAINLALDAVYRFRDMPLEYFSDWLQVAAEESRHFLMLESFLADNGAGYGDYDAHNGLWEMALKTDHDVMVRMALVPRVLEARGLDVTPGMISKLAAEGERRLVEILQIIHREEIGHVRIGTHWFTHACRQRSLSPQKVFTDLLDDHMKGAIHGPFDEASRIQAGFTEDELQYLVNMSEKREAIA